MSAVVLGLLDLFQKVFKILGVDYLQLRSIVEAKLLMDNRRHVIGYNRRQTAAPKNTFLTTFLIYILFGCFPAAMILFFPSLTLSLIFFFSYLMMMITMTLITDFSSVLLDTSDNTILLPRPVDGRTLFVARIVHIFAYLAQLSLGLSIAPIIAIGVYEETTVFLAFVAGILLSVLFALAFTNALYLLILRFTSEDKIRNIINYLQIGMTILVVGGYQLGPRMIARMEGQSFEIDRWSLLIPPAWMTGMVEAVQSDTWDGLHAGLTFLAVSMPITAVYLVNKYLSPAFSRKLVSLESTGGQSAVQPMRNTRIPFYRRISGILTSSRTEQSAFELTYALLGRDRKLKLKIYPAFGYLAVFAGIFLIRGPQAFGGGQYYHLAMIYMILLVLQMVMREIAYSDDYKASWIFFVAPVAKPGEILAGTLKAVFLRLFLPGYIFIMVAVFITSGTSTAIIIDVIAGFLNICILLLLMLILRDQHIPFSLAPSMRAQSGRFARMLLTTVLMLAMGLLHYTLIQWPMILLAAMPVQVAVIILLSRQYRSVQWNDIKQ